MSHSRRLKTITARTPPTGATVPSVQSGISQYRRWDAASHLSCIGVQDRLIWSRRSGLAATRASQAGACGFVPRNGSLDEVVTAVRLARPGGMHVAPSALGGATSRGPAPVETRIRLTDREQEVLTYLCEGHAPKAIARLLGITVNTARGYLKAIFAKLEVGSRVEAVLKAQRLGLVPTAP